jgi:hypothetical protein
MCGDSAQITVVSLLKLHGAKALCLVFVEIACRLHKFPTPAASLWWNMILYMLGAVLLPFVVLSVFEVWAPSVLDLAVFGGPLVVCLFVCVCVCVCVCVGVCVGTSAFVRVFVGRPLCSRSL